MKANVRAGCGVTCDKVSFSGGSRFSPCAVGPVYGANAVSSRCSFTIRFDNFLVVSKRGTKSEIGEERCLFPSILASLCAGRCDNCAFLMELDDPLSSPKERCATVRTGLDLPAAASGCKRGAGIGISVTD